MRKTAGRVAAALVVVCLVVAALLARRHGVEPEVLRSELLALGCLAAPAFLAAFALGELLHLPGIVFVVVARIVFGPSLGLVLGYSGALLALTVSFVVARGLVRAARASDQPWRPRIRLLRRAFETLEAHPVRNIALLRLVLWLAPPLTYALAATKIRLRDHLVGCAVGLVPPVLAANWVYAALT